MEKWCVYYMCGLLVLVQCFLTAVAYTPVCESPKLCENNNNEVCVTCTARWNYNCELYTSSNPDEQVSPVAASVSFNRQGGYSCTARVRVTKLGPGNHYFRMYLFGTENTGVFSAFTTPISFPVLVCDPPRLCEKNNKVCVTCTAVGIPSGDRGHYYCSLYRSSRLQEQVRPLAASVSYNKQGGYSCTASVLVTKLGPGTHYFRMYLFRTGNTGVFSAFTTPISFHGPLAVYVDASPNPVNICPRTSHDVTVVCSVKFEDIYPEPVFQLYWGGQQVQNEKGKLRTDSYKKRYYTLVNHYTVNVNQAGSINFRCEAYNSVHTNEKASSNTLTVPVNAPPPSSPKLTISRGVYHGIQGYSVPMTPGQKYSASCDVSGGQPPVSSVTLTCPGVSQKTMSGTSVSLAGIVVAESADQEKCVCAAQHVSQCYNLRTEVTISVLFPLQTVTFERTDSDNNSPVDICSDSPQQIIRLQCRATFNPQPQFTILVNEQEYARSRPERVVGSGKNTYVYSYDFVPKAGGTYNTTCTANGDKTAPVESDQLTILVREPPQTEPEIIITNIGPSGNVSKNPEVVLNNTATNVTCLVDGGYPPVTSQDILLTCGNISGSEQITLPPGLSTDGEIACSCSASHITGCYSRSAHTRFKISALPLSTEASTDNSDVTVIASVGVAVVIVVVVVVVIVLVVRRRRRHSDRLSQDDPYVYPRDIALVTRPVDDPRRVTGQPTKMSNSTGRQRDRLSQDDTYLIPCDAPLATEPVDDPRRVTGQLTETGNSTSHQDENLYEEVDSDDTPPSDIHSPIPVMRTMAEIITIEAPTDPSPYNNVSASAPRSRAGQDGQGHITNPTGEYDVFPGPDSVAFLSDPYTSMKPENEYSQADEVDASYLSTQASSTGPEGYVSMEKIKNQGGSPYENE